jgi:hypothetical protein
MGTAVFDSVDGSLEIKKRDLDVIELDELTTARR